MDWKRLLSFKRLFIGPETAPRPLGRTPFEADVDRIVFDGAFRRLSRKTQVHPLAANDHVHTRLTHSLEVAQVGRTLGIALWKKIHAQLPKNCSSSDLAAILQAACLGHDIGNPPFGHAGEDAMAHWFDAKGKTFFKGLSQNYQRDLASFNGNAQGFRILTQTSNHVFKGGLRLTYATLGAFLKYPWSTRRGTKEFGVFLSEEGILKDVARELGLKPKGDHQWSRHPLAYLAEAADDICYGIMDLEDAVELRILTFDQVEKLLIRLFDAKKKKEIRKGFEPKESYRVNLARLRGHVYDQLVPAAIQGFMKGYKRIMEGDCVDTENVFSFLNHGDERRDLILDAKKLAREAVFPDQKKVELELGSYAMFDCLLSAFCEAALDQAQTLRSPPEEVGVRWKTDLVMRLLGDHAPSDKNKPRGSSWTEYQCIRRVLDFVNGMTDNYATYIAKQLQGMGSAGVQRP